MGDFQPIEDFEKNLKEKEEKHKSEEVKFDITVQQDHNKAEKQCKGPFVEIIHIVSEKFRKITS